LPYDEFVPLRVLTWNVWWRFGPWEARQEALLQTLVDSQADVVCLQEVWATEEGEDQAEKLAKSLGMSYARTPSPFWQGYSFGNAVLSRWPILSVENFALPAKSGSLGHRSVLVASIAAPFGVVPVACTHVDYLFDQSELRHRQVQRIAEHCATSRTDPENSFPLLLCGDLNAVPDSDEIRALTGRTSPLVPGLVFQDCWELVGDGPGHTWSSRNPYLADATWPNRRLDYIMVSWPRPKGLGKPIDVELIGTAPVNGVMASDHFGVMATLRSEATG
jgi:endonuclease/exonuclease/phosphatase family metal-dependent hydrolase